MQYESYEIDRAEQWIADVYHCSDCWGQKMTDDDMRILLEEANDEADLDDYTPPVGLYHECAELWNSLCELYPN